jgi:hypothetical protein
MALVRKGVRCSEDESMRLPKMAQLCAPERLVLIALGGMGDERAATVEDY